MTNVFKKTGIAAAVAGALMAVSGGAQAQAYESLVGNEITLAAPDDVMLVPYVICDPAATGGQINTLVGVTTIFPERGANGRPDRRTKKGDTKTMHWRFYNARSEHKLDGIIPVSDNDFVRYDWCDQLAKSGQTSLNGVPGYLLFHGDSIRFNTSSNILVGESLFGTSVADPLLSAGNNAYNREMYSNCADVGCPSGTWEGLKITLPNADSSKPAVTTAFDTSVLVNDIKNPANLAFNRTMWLYGHSYLIQGNCGSQAFIPILSAPIWDTVVRNGYPAIERLERGIDFTTAVLPYAPRTEYQDLVLRYFLDPALSTGNQFVFWFNSNQDVVRSAVPIETFDSEQVYQFSFTVGLPNELNIIRSTPSAPAFPGMIHTEDDPRGVVVNTGLINFYVGQVSSTVPSISSGVAFNLLSLGAGGNNAQIQTEMATGSYDLIGPF